MTIEVEKEEFLKLLDEGHTEQEYQSFMEKHTRFIPSHLNLKFVA